MDRTDATFLTASTIVPGFSSHVLLTELNLKIAYRASAAPATARPSAWTVSNFSVKSTPGLLNCVPEGLKVYTGPAGVRDTVLEAATGATGSDATATETTAEASPGRVPGGIDTPVPSEKETMPPSAGVIGLAVIMGVTIGIGVVWGVEVDWSGEVSDGIGVLVTVTVGVLLLYGTAVVPVYADAVELDLPGAGVVVDKVAPSAGVVEVAIVGALVDCDAVPVPVCALLVVPATVVYEEEAGVVAPGAGVVVVNGA